MSKKFRSALKGMKDTYPSPNPEREAAFLRSLPTKEVKKKRLPFLHTANKPFWYSIPAVVTAAVLITVGTGVYQHMGHHNLPSIELPAETQTTTADGQIYETQQISASTEYNTNAPPSSDFEEYVHTDTSIDTHTNISTNSSTDVNILQTDATEAPYVPEKTDSIVLETTYIVQTSSSKTTVPHQTVTTAVLVTTVPQTTPKATTDRNDT
ncbi:MAG: hypothetical protein K2I93_07275, partial [Oscillospiraceae bacterium]|nr:hypothetical protein [Oscillospiraceae bacterium]